MSDYIERLRLGKRGELFVFTQLLQRGVIPYVPLLDVEGVDAVVRKPGGGFLEVQVKINNTPKTPMWWNTALVPNSDDFILVFVSVPKDWTAWILPASEFLKQCTGRDSASGTLDLNLASKQREVAVERFRNNWDIIVRMAETEPVEQVSMDVEPN